MFFSLRERLEGRKENNTLCTAEDVTADPLSETKVMPKSVYLRKEPRVSDPFSPLAWHAPSDTNTALKAMMEQNPMTR